jgi:hypothetical protein
VTTDLAVRWITEEAEFLALREPWNRLVPSASGRDVFLRHEWFDAAWQWRKDERCAPRIALVSRGAQLIGICPLVLQATQPGGLPARRLEFLSVPDTQFCDLVCDRAELPPSAPRSVRPERPCARVTCWTSGTCLKTPPRPPCGKTLRRRCECERRPGM